MDSFHDDTTTMAVLGTAFGLGLGKVGVTTGAAPISLAGFAVALISEVACTRPTLKSILPVAVVEFSVQVNSCVCSISV